MGPASCNDPAHADLLGMIQRLAEQFEEQKQKHSVEVAALRAEIDDLKAKLGRNSSNSSKPPSTDSPYKRSPPKAPSGKKPGGQPGHPGSTRHLLKAEDVDHFVPHWPPTCSCGCALPQVADGDPVRDQKWELPPVKPVVTEHQYHAVVCLKCGRRTVATPTPDVPKGAFGPRAEATAVYFIGAGRLSVMETKRVFNDLLNFPISAGGLMRIAVRATKALQPAYAEALEAVRRAAVTHADETPWYLRGYLCWLWFAGTQDLRVFKVDPRRTIEARRSFLGDVLLGVLVADRYVAYEEQPRERRQFCLAHLRRDAQALIDRGGAAKPFGTKLMALLDEAFKEWRAYRDEHHDRPLMRDRLRPTWEALVDLLVAGADGEEGRVANFCAHLIMRAEALWTFTEVEGCPPDNNLSERSLRKPVQWRRNSLGSQSEIGCRFVERILTAVETLRAQGRDVLAFLVETMSAAAQGRAPPSLLPAVA